MSTCGLFATSTRDSPHLWERVAPKFSFAVRRDAQYLQWKYIALPHIRYNIVALDRGSTIGGYAVFRHLDEPRGRVTALVDLLADPDDRQALASLLSAVERDARTAGSDKIRAFVMNAAFRNVMRGARLLPRPLDDRARGEGECRAGRSRFLRSQRRVARDVRRFRPGPLMLHLTIGIDTESDNQWSTESRLQPDVHQHLCAAPPRRAVSEVRRTTDVPDYVSRSRQRRDRRRRFAGSQKAAGCEIGAHHHVWETPPCDADEARGLPYALQIPLDRFDRQVASLTAAIARTAGYSPVSYRSGRYGFDASHTAVLEKAGYLVDTSVHPLLYDAYRGGPDFVDAPLTPYLLSYDSAVRPGASSLLEVPVSAGAQPIAAAMAGSRVRPRAVAIPDEALPPPRSHRQDVVAAPVVLRRSMT